MTQRNEELGFSLMNTDSGNSDRIAGDCHRSDTAIPLSVVSVSPFPHWNMNETSQYYKDEPAGHNSTIDSSQFQSCQNFQMDHNYPYGEEEDKPLPCRPDSGFPCPEGYIGWPHQYKKHDNPIVPDDTMNAAFNLNSFDKPDSGGKCVTPSDSSASRPRMLNPSGMTMSGNIALPLLNMNLGMSPFNPSQGGGEPSLAPRKHDERFMSVGSGSNREYKSNSVMPKINVTGNSEGAFLPPVNTYHNQLGSRSFLNSGLDMNDTFSGFQNNSGSVSDIVHTGDHEVLLDSRPGLRMAPSYVFQRPAAGDQNTYLSHVNWDLGLGRVKDTGREFADVGHTNGFERCMVLPSMPFVGSQTMPCDSEQSRVKGQLVPSSIGMVTDQSPSELLPENNGSFSSQFFVSPPLVTATRSARVQDPSSNHGQPQVVGSIQRSNSHLGPRSSGMQTGKGNITAQVTRSSIMPSLKRAASQPPPSTVQDQRRKTLPTQPLIHPSIPTWTRLPPSVPNTPQAIPPLVHTAQSLTPQATHSFVPPLLSTTWTKSALSAQNTAQTIPSLMHTAPFLPPNDRRISSFHPSSDVLRLPNRQLIAQSLAHQRLRASIMPSAPSIAPNYVKYEDKTPEPIGYKCLLCKRDLSYTSEGPIFQPPVPPAAAVLSCGHTFHEYCLERITPDDQSKDPPCIPCALPES
ncbi:uncharacterized protein LOC133315495 [Gastrolobium bilobum]|uniref:uncharacterized protein LOC133315495 n=1 Tax=Gastrolobium bilobum TaxID=150636 RepID=UPI002AB294E8|nr:uncharacterized protein LOC133315495 [Gastrolobium bilobum]XP_061373115.1 uncharacterized protein LOC133315495 [Gastrolobium bilobum]